DPLLGGLAVPQLGPRIGPGNRRERPNHHGCQTLDHPYIMPSRPPAAHTSPGTACSGIRASCLGAASCEVVTRSESRRNRYRAAGGLACRRWLPAALETGRIAPGVLRPRSAAFGRLAGWSAGGRFAPRRWRQLEFAPGVLRPSSAAFGRLKGWSAGGGFAPRRWKQLESPPACCGLAAPRSGGWRAGLPAVASPRGAGEKMERVMRFERTTITLAT
ncbi:MAG: hypothetical protein RL398_1122, partial [Planctomycetota bacterium]